MNVITHRGLNFSRPGYFLESSLEAFVDQLDNGFGLEFDVRLTKDLYEYAMKNGHLKYRDAGAVRELKLDTSNWETPASCALTCTLPF